MHCQVPSCFVFVRLYFIVYLLELLYAFFWVTPRRLEFICRHFGTLCLFHLHRRVGVSRMN